jgi:lipopolysaccharide/colanic/teichoic acid biosynthesis glycosyltransferase
VRWTWSAVIALVLSAPVMLLAALATIETTAGAHRLDPRRTRRKPFTFYKLRSMVNGPTVTATT